MVKSIEMTKDHRTSCGLELKKGSKHNVYQPLYKELVEDKKVAKLQKTTKQGDK